MQVKGSCKFSPFFAIISDLYKGVVELMESLNGFNVRIIKAGTPMHTFYKRTSAFVAV